MSSENKMSDMEELREVLEVVSDKVPSLIKNLLTSVFTKENGQNLGASIGAFYKELVESGIPEQEALEMAKSFISTFKEVTKNGTQQNK